LPSPRRFLKTRCSLSDKLSNMIYFGAERPTGRLDSLYGRLGPEDVHSVRHN
jgi:hypothetical protein